MGYGSPVGCCRGRGSGCSRPGYGINPLGGGFHYPQHRVARTYTGLGKQSLGGHKQNLVHTRTQEKGAVTPQETDPELPVSAQGSQWRQGSAVACCGVGSTECSSSTRDPLKEVTIIFITSTIVLPQVNNREDFPGGSGSKASAYNAGDLGSIQVSLDQRTRSYMPQLRVHRPQLRPGTAK